ncbi:MAG: hypothetical protein Q7R56_01025 [Nanoarchaeota archaeon]|nr:hypothetical protein [Nanoarchaeota archaeon]
MILTLLTAVNILLLIGIITLLVRNQKRETPTIQKSLQAIALGIVIFLLATIITFAVTLRADYHLLLAPATIIETLQQLSIVALYPLSGICFLIAALRNK